MFPHALEPKVLGLFKYDISFIIIFQNYHKEYICGK